MNKLNDTIGILKNNNYFWFYPKSKQEIKFIVNDNSFFNCYDLIREKFNKNPKNKDIFRDIVFLIITYDDMNKHSNIKVVVNFYKIKNELIIAKEDEPYYNVYFNNNFIIKKGLKIKYLKNIVKHFYFGNYNKKYIINYNDIEK